MDNTEKTTYSIKNSDSYYEYEYPDEQNDPVNHPAHYTQGGIECIDAIEAACTGLDGQEGYLVGQVIKYIWRWKHKNGLQDLEKAKWYLERLISLMSEKPANNSQ